MIVIDASVATKLINTQEEGSDSAVALLASHLESKEKITVPPLIFLEVANALATKSKLRESYIRKGIHLLHAADFVVQEANETDIVDASLLAKKYGTTVYDMIYAVIARNNKSTLITADNKFVSKVNFPYVKSLF